MAKVLQKVFDQIHERVAGLDVHKAQVTAAVRVPASDGGRLLEVAEFKTTVTGLLALRDWLFAHGVTYVAMEATGVYWKELYPEVVDAVEEEGGVPSRLLKTEAGMAGRKARQWRMFAGSPTGRATRAESRWMSSRVKARYG